MLKTTLMAAALLLPVTPTMANQLQKGSKAPQQPQAQQLSVNVNSKAATKAPRKVSRQEQVAADGHKKNADDTEGLRPNPLKQEAVSQQGAINPSRPVTHH
ncbi:MAG: hypothetical protein ABFR97_08570 [Thermodesulfobacteriota bacterium]